MSSYFVVQVRTGFEIETKEFLKSVLEKNNSREIKAIYAMETYTEVLKDGNSIPNLEQISNKDIENYLEIRQIQSSISNLRNSLKLLKENNNGDEDSLKMLQSYRDEIHELTSKVKEYRTGTKKINSLLKGYILIETSTDYNYLPNHLWHLVKSVPYVIGFPSRYNIPNYEIESFFESIDMSPQIEIEFNELMITAEEIEAIKEEIMSQTEQNSEETAIEKVYKKIAHQHSDIQKEITNLTQYLALHSNRTTSYSTIKNLQKWLSSIKITKHVSSQNQKETVHMPFTVFKQLFKNLSFQCTKQQFISKLRTFIFSNINITKHEQVVLTNP